MAINYLERIPIPNSNSVNTGLSPCSQFTMLKLIGPPNSVKTENCVHPDNPYLNSLIVTESIGPWHVTGLKPAVYSLRRIFEKIKAGEPALYPRISTAGMLCCRLVRGSKNSWSNHSWGTAIDLKIDGILDSVGDGKCLRGLLVLYKYFHAEGWYWGVEFSGPREDSMHFEVANETIRKWLK